MEPVAGEDVVDVVALACVVVEIEGLIRFLAMFALALKVVKAVEPLPVEKSDEVPKLVSA
jgi:hypothetical protein